VNFDTNFNVLLSKYIVHQLVNIKKTLIISRCMVQPRKFTSIVSMHTLRLSGAYQLHKVLCHCVRNIHSLQIKIALKIVKYALRFSRRGQACNF
jgi:hypothetical protein